MRILKRAFWFLALCGVLLSVLGAFFVRFDLPAELVDKKYSSEQSQFLDLSDGTRAHIRDEGAKEGPVLVLLHGSNASLHTWEPWVESLSDEFRIVTMDLPGHGLTGRNARDDYSMEAYVGFVGEVVDHLGLGRFTLGGNSMGGHVSWRYALAWPRRVEGLILVDSGGFPSLGNESPPLVFRLLRYGFFRFLFRYVFVRGMIEEGLHTAYGDSGKVTESLIARYADLNRREGARYATALRFGSYRGAFLRLPKDVLRMPALIMWGREDKLISVERAADFEEALPNSEVVIYDGVGHAPMEEVPERSARDAARFLSGIIRKP